VLDRVDTAIKCFGDSRVGPALIGLQQNVGSLDLLAGSFALCDNILASFSFLI
jgi:hypothetical protein